MEGKTLVHTLDIQIAIFVLHCDNRQLVRIHNTLRPVRTGLAVLNVLWSEYLIMASGLLWFNKFLASYKNQGTASETNTSQDHLKITDGFRNRNKTPNRTQYLQVLVAANSDRGNTKLWLSDFARHRVYKIYCPCGRSKYHIDRSLTATYRHKFLHGGGG